MMMMMMAMMTATTTIDGDDDVLSNIEKLPLVIDEVKVPVAQLQHLDKQQMDKVSQAYHYHSINYIFQYIPLFSMC